MGQTRAPMKLGELKLLPRFVLVESLVASVLLGVDFHLANALTLDFT